MAVPFTHNNFIVAQNNEILNTLHPQLFTCTFSSTPLFYKCKRALFIGKNNNYSTRSLKHNLLALYLQNYVKPD